MLLDIGLVLEPFDAKQAGIAGQLWPQCKPFGLSLADRCRLALAVDTESTVLTAGRAWMELPLEIEIQLLR